MHFGPHTHTETDRRVARGSGGTGSRVIEPRDREIVRIYVQFFVELLSEFACAFVPPLLCVCVCLSVRLSVSPYVCPSARLLFYLNQGTKLFQFSPSNEANSSLYFPFNFDFDFDCSLFLPLTLSYCLSLSLPISQISEMQRGCCGGPQRKTINKFFEKCLCAQLQFDVGFSYKKQERERERGRERAAARLS